MLQLMAAAMLSSSSPNLASESTFPPLPSRPPPDPPDPPHPNVNPTPPIVNSTTVISSDLNHENLESIGMDHSTQIPLASNFNTLKASLTKCDFASLFNSLPRNAGVYEPQHFDIPRDAPPKSLPDLVTQAGMNYWSNYLVGFFLDGTLNYLAVANFLRKYWKLKGDVEIKFDGRFFYFKFSNDFEKERVLNADPIFIRGRMFILTKWDPMIGNAQSQIRKVPVWIHFYRIPTILWTLIGINWLVCHIGKLICFDNSTERMNRFRYAKALVEISPDFELPESIPIAALGENCPPVILSYDWKPMICTACKVFGHETISCELNKSNEHNNGNQSVTRDGGQRDDVNVNTGNQRQGKQVYTNQNNWNTVNSKKKKYWKKKETVNVQEVGNGNNNSFEILNNSTIGNDGRISDVQPVVENESTDPKTNESIEDQHDMDNGININNNIDSTPNDRSNSAGAKDSGSSSANNISSACSTLAATMSCSSTFSHSSPSNSSLKAPSSSSGDAAKPRSPYENLRPPDHFKLPPPVIGSGLTSPNVTSTMAQLSSAKPTSAMPSFSSKSKKLKGKFWADDLDEGQNFNLDDILPAGSNVKSHKRHTRRNPSPLFESDC